MKKLLPALVSVLLFAILTTVAESAEMSSEMRVLDRYLGAWESEVVIRPSQWIPKQKERRETKNVEWILDNRFQQLASRSDEHETREIHRYDKHSKMYQKWTFDSDGGTGYWTGVWSARSATMTWTLDFGVIKGTMIDRFLDEDIYETTLIIKDSEGKLLLDVQAECLRLKK